VWWGIEDGAILIGGDVPRSEPIERIMKAERIRGVGDWEKNDFVNEGTRRQGKIRTLAPSVPTLAVSTLIVMFLFNSIHYFLLFFFGMNYGNLRKCVVLCMNM
jgi:hypothetical protein